jgi:uncharacterized integral membrane protein (TIGR00697 family)
MSEEKSELKEQIFLIIAGIFIACLICSNLILQKFFTWSFLGLYNFEISVGIIPYPITFLCTDLISEIYGKKRADQVVIAGFIGSLFILILMLIANNVPATLWSPVDQTTFSQVFGLFAPAIIASMFAYLTAQFIDIRLFHFWKDLTQGKHLWLRNNGSTIVSQLIDTSSVLLILCFFGVISWDKFSVLLQNGFMFKVLFALGDTPFFYLGVWFLNKQFNSEL